MEQNSETTNSHKNNVFVYGTLRSTECNHRVMKNVEAVFLSNSQIRAEAVPGLAYPAIKEGLGLVDGEVYAVPDYALKVLDRFEGHPWLYTRKEVETTDGLKVSVYYGNEILPNPQAPTPLTGSPQH